MMLNRSAFIPKNHHQGYGQQRQSHGSKKQRVSVGSASGPNRPKIKSNLKQLLSQKIEANLLGKHHRSQQVDDRVGNRKSKQSKGKGSTSSSKGSQ